MMAKGASEKNDYLSVFLSSARFCLVPDFCDSRRRCRKSQISPVQGLHDGHTQALRGSIFQARRAGLVLLVQEVVLDLAKLPRVRIDDPKAESLKLVVRSHCHVGYREMRSY
jgi:hypothetical protein